MAKKKKTGLFNIVQQAAPKSKTEAEGLVKQFERRSNYKAVKEKSEKLESNYKRLLRSEPKKDDSWEKLRSQPVREKPSAAQKTLADLAAKNLAQGAETPLSTNRKRALSGQGASRPMIVGNPYQGLQRNENDIIKRRTMRDVDYAKMVDAGLNGKGFTPTKLTAGLPTAEELKYRQQYGYDKKAKEIFENRYRNPNRDWVKDAGVGFLDAWRTESAEKSMEQQYGKNNLDMDLINEARGRGAYTAGNVAGQMSQFLALAPVSAPLEAAALSRAGFGAARAGKAVSGVKSLRDAVKIAGIRNAVQTAVGTPVNLVDALKENNLEDAIKRFGMNELLDVGFGTIFEIPMLRRNIHVAKAFRLNQQAQRTANVAEKEALQRSALGELEKLDGQTLDAIRAELVRGNNLDETFQTYLQGTGRRGRVQQQQDIIQNGYRAPENRVAAEAETGYNINGGELDNGTVPRADAATEPGVRPGEGDVRATNEGVYEQVQPAPDSTYVEPGPDAGSNAVPGSDVPVRSISEEQRRVLDDAGITNAELRGADNASFSDALQRGREANPKYGGYVDPQGESEMAEKGATGFLSADKQAGVAVGKDGNIFGVFNSGKGKKGVVKDLLITARANGGVKLDCYGWKLANMYEGGGFVPVGRVPFNEFFVRENFKNGLITEQQMKTLLDEKPDIYFMMANEDDIDTVVRKMAGDEYQLSTREELESLPVFEDYPDPDGEMFYGYDQAAEYRDNLLDASGNARRAEAEPVRPAAEPQAEPRTEGPQAEPRAETAGEAQGANAETRSEKAARKRREKYGTDDQELADSLREAEKASKNGKDKGLYPNKLPKKTKSGKETPKGLDSEFRKIGKIDPAMEGLLRKAYVDEGLGKLTKGVKETSKKADRAWELTPDDEIKKMNEAVKAYKDGDRTIKGYDSMQDFIASCNSGEAYYSRRIVEAFEKGDLTDVPQMWSHIQDIREARIRTASEGGATLRQYKEWLNTTPSGRVYIIKKQIADIEERYAKLLNGKHIDFDETKWYMRFAQLRKESDPVEMAKALDELSNEIWDQVPATMKEKMDTWRMTAMLLNPRTHARNIVGNAFFRPAIYFKDIIGTGMEKAAVKAGVLDADAVTKAVLNPLSESDRALVKTGKEIFDKYAPVIRGENRYFDNVGKGIGNRPLEGHGVWQAGRTSDNPMVRGYRKALDKAAGMNSKWLEGQDTWFMKSKFSDSYAKVCKARGWDPAKMTPEQVDEAVEIAAEEALRSTYRDASKLATYINQLRRTDPRASTAAKTRAWAIDTTMPFVKTPINILRRSADYSPVGLMNGLGKFAKAKKAGDAKAMIEALDRLAAGTTGTGAFLIGMWLADFEPFHLNANLGDDNSGYYDRDRGLQNFALNIGDDESGTSITLDWLVPFAVPIFSGVATRGYLKNHEFDIGTAIDMLGQTIDPAVELSVLSGIRNLYESVTSGQQSAGQAVTSAGLETGLNYLSQFMPTLSGQVARTIDPVRRDTSASADSNTIRTVRKWSNKQIAKIPGASKLLNPYINVWGEEQVNTDSLPVRAFNNFVNPSYVSKYKTTAVDKEILRLNQADPSNLVTPTKLAGKKVGFQGEQIRLANDEVTLYNKTKGQKAKADLEKLIKSSEYKNASDDDKRKMIKRVYDSAAREAKVEALVKHGEDPWDVITDDYQGKRKPDYESAQAAGLDYKTYDHYMTTKEWDKDGNGRANKAEITAWLDKQDLTGEQKAEIYDRIAPWNSKNPYGKGKSKSGYTASSGSRGRGGRSGGRRRGGGGSKAKRTASSKSYSATHTASDLRSNIKPVSIPASSLKGLSKSQRKALLKMINKRLEA